MDRCIADKYNRKFSIGIQPHAYGDPELQNFSYFISMKATSPGKVEI